MDTMGWLALAGVVLLAFVVALTDGRRRLGRRPPDRGRERGRERERTRGPERGRGPAGDRGPGRTRPPGRPVGGGRTGRAAVRPPRAGEIWWAEVPYEDGPGAKDRPCLVLARRGDRVLVAKITSKPHAERPGVIALPPGVVGDARGRQSFLETDELREVPVSGFRRHAGKADPALWGRVRHLAR
ncbi:type II toxin-antitoxin system PemK/MazF family toxin [Streptomyces sp. NPDC048717]|uniref:type II toxin-antitoxin system PemK/MazF family toxin n=1 Tax=Streptomyces sp. NPDC048717 TaxID=3154928 RepID=UPI00341E784A